MRWVQRLNEETGKYEFIPRDRAARNRDAGAAIHGDIESFVSPVDGSVITDRKALREHNKRNNVVNQAEFSPEFLDRAKQKREDMYNGVRSRDEIRADKMAIYETITKAERQHN